MYDPLVGRFLSPDNVIQSPDNTQNYNRYTYCLNNPLKYNDPSGWLMCPGSGGFTPSSPTNMVDFSRRCGDSIGGGGGGGDDYGIGSTGWGGNGGVLPFDYKTIYRSSWFGYAEWENSCRPKNYASFWGPLLASAQKSNDDIPSPSGTSGDSSSNTMPGRAGRGGTIFVVLKGALKGFDANVFCSDLQKKLVLNGFAQDTEVEIYNANSWFVSGEKAFIEIRPYDCKNTEDVAHIQADGTGGYGVFLSHHAVLYSGLNMENPNRNQQMSYYVQAALHELGHSIFGFEHSHFVGDVMNTIWSYDSGSNYRSIDQILIYNSLWGR